MRPPATPRRCLGNPPGQAATYREPMTTATAAELEAAWAERVQANRAQVEQIREVPDRDFYAPVSQKCNALFRAAWEKKGPKCALWEAVRNLFAEFEVSSMRQIYEAIAFGHERPKLKPLVEQAMARGQQAPNTS